ncbi:MAG: magnesium citrate secondary transporter [Nitritalea sp.]
MDTHKNAISTFHVWLNPYFWVPALLFWINQYLERGLEIHLPYVHAYGDDLLAMPVVFGLTLQVYRWFHPLREAFIFTPIQLLVGLLYFSLLFEVLLPRYSSTYTADPWDVLCYTLGTLYFYYLLNRPACSS